MTLPTNIQKVKPFESIICPIRLDKIGSGIGQCRLHEFFSGTFVVHEFCFWLLHQLAFSFERGITETVLRALEKCAEDSLTARALFILLPCSRHFLCAVLMDKARKKLLYLLIWTDIFPVGWEQNVVNLTDYSLCSICKTGQWLWTGGNSNFYNKRISSRKANIYHHKYFIFIGNCEMERTVRLW